MARPKRKDKTRTVLRTGELQRSDGSYQYSWTDENHKRRYVYSKTLEALRIKEEAIEKDKSDGIKAEARYVTLDDLYELWKDLKRGLKNNTFENYKYIYETFVRRQIGSKRVSTFLKSDIKRFYNYLVDERGLKPATVDGVHNILHQIFDMAVDDNYIRNNPTNNVLRIGSVINFVSLVINGSNLERIKYEYSYQRGAYYYGYCKGAIKTNYFRK